MWTKAAPTSSETDASRPAAVSFTYFASSGSASQRSTSVIAAALSTRFGSTLRTNALTADESRMSRRCQSIRLSSGAWRPRWVAITSCPRRSASWPMYCPRRPVPPTSRTRATSSGWMRGPKPFRGERICSAAQYPESSMDLIQGVVVRPLKQIHDERGYLMEMLRTDWPEFERFAQSYITIGYPGIVKGWHYHKTQTDHFVVVRGTAKVVCYDNRDRSPTKGKVNEFFPGERDAMLIKIPPHVIHGFKAIGHEPVYLVNFPPETHVDRSILEAGDFVRTDVMGTWSVLEACRKNDVKRVCHISTDEVYGEAADRPSTESDPLMPKSPYAASKAGADRLAFSYFTTYGLPVVISRCANNYGPYQHPEKLIPLFVTNALEDTALPVYGTGANTRDWVHVYDHFAP